MKQLKEFGIELLTQIYNKLSSKRKQHKLFSGLDLQLWEPENYPSKELAIHVWEILESMHTYGMEKRFIQKLVDKEVVYEYLYYGELVYKILTGLAFPPETFNIPPELRKLIALKLAFAGEHLERYTLQKIIDEYFGGTKTVILKESIIPIKVKRLKELALKALKGKLDLNEVYKYLKHFRFKLLNRNEIEEAAFVEELLKALKPTPRQRIIYEKRVERGWLHYVYSMQLKEFSKDIAFLYQTDFQNILMCYMMTSCKAIKVVSSSKLPCTEAEKEILIDLSIVSQNGEWIVPLENLGNLKYPFPLRGGNCQLLPSINI